MPSPASYARRTIILALAVGLIIIPFWMIEKMTGGAFPLLTIHTQAWSWFAPYRPGSLSFFNVPHKIEGPRRTLMIFLYIVYVLLWFVILILVYPPFLVGFILFFVLRTGFSLSHSTLTRLSNKLDGEKSSSDGTGSKTGNESSTQDIKIKAAEAEPQGSLPQPPKTSKPKHADIDEAHHLNVLEHGVKPKIKTLAPDVVKAYRAHGWQSGTDGGEDALIPPSHFESHYTS